MDKKKIYIADDEHNIRLGIKTFLEGAGFEVCDFENGDLLFSEFNKTPADFVILDVMMPGSNGFVICRELRKISTVPIIMLTARASDLDYATGLDLGSDDYLIKPFSPMALVKRIEAIFRRMEFDKKVYTQKDMLTGLYDKTSGINLIENKLMTSDAKTSHALFMIDIDYFKDINDKLGHDVGDKVLAEIACILTRQFRDADIISRFGGDEFIVFATNIGDKEFIEQKAKEICSVLQKSYGNDENKCNISASIGITCFPEHAQTFEELFKLADRAMYETKKRGRNSYTIFSLEDGKSQ